jgi:hypothetical protein
MTVVVVRTADTPHDGNGSPGRFGEEIDCAIIRTDSRFRRTSSRTPMETDRIASDNYDTNKNTGL